MGLSGESAYLTGSQCNHGLNGQTRGTARSSTQINRCRKIQALMLNKSYSLQALSPFLAWLSVKTRPHRRCLQTHHSSHNYFLPSVLQPNLHPNSTCPSPVNTLLLAAVYAVEVPIKCLLKMIMQLPSKHISAQIILLVLQSFLAGVRSSVNSCR